MKVELSIEEAARLHRLAEVMAKQSDHLPPGVSAAYTTATRKLQGALERSGARLVDGVWTIHRRSR